MKRDPRRGWTIDDVQEVCRSFGVLPYVPDQGKHCVLFHPWVEGLLTVPAARPIKAVYVLLAVDLVENVMGMKR